MVVTASTEHSSASEAVNLRQVAEMIVASSGLFLVLAYVSGRLYMQAFYGEFDVNLNELNLSVQDVMFSSWEALLPVVLIFLALICALPWYLSYMTDSIAKVQSVGTLIDGLQAKVQYLSDKQEDLETIPVGSPGYFDQVAEIGKLLQELKEEQERVEEMHEWSTGHPALTRVFGILGALPISIAALIKSIPLLISACVLSTSS